MEQAPVEVWRALGDSVVERRLDGFAQYQEHVAVLNLAPEGDVRSQASGRIQSDASIRVAGFGNPLLTNSDTDLLAPYGQEVTLAWTVTYGGGLEHVIPAGVFRISGNDGGTFDRRGGRVFGWTAGVSLKDRFHVLDRAKIIDPASPVPGNSMYQELRRLVDVPLLENPAVPDVAVPPALEYESRLDAVHALAALAGCTPALTREGALTLRLRDRWLTETVPDFIIRAVIDWDDFGQSDQFYNFVWAHDSDNEFSAFAPLEEEGNPRSVSRAGMVSYELSSPLITSHASAQAAAMTALARLQRERAVTVTVTVGAQGLLLDLGDFGWFVDEVNQRSVLGEVTGITVPNDPTGAIRVDVIAAERHAEGVA